MCHDFAISLAHTNFYSKYNCCILTLFLTPVMDMYRDIAEYFKILIDESSGIDVAEAEFKRMIADDDKLRASYRDWCQENGYSQRHGFSDFAEEYLENRESVWDSLNNFDEEE